MQGQLLGTPAYMAPEQAQGRHDLVNQRTDIYGLGAILYEILTGRPPFIAPKTAEIIRKVCQEAPTPPRQIVAEIAPGLEAVCLKALRKSRSERVRLGQPSWPGSAARSRRRAGDGFRRTLDAAASLRWARRHKTTVRPPPPCWSPRRSALPSAPFWSPESETRPRPRANRPAAPFRC